MVPVTVAPNENAAFTNGEVGGGAQDPLAKPVARASLPVTSKLIARLNPLIGGNENSFEGIGPTISQFPANGLTAGTTGTGGTLPPPQPDRNNPIPQAVKLNQAQIFIWLKI
jgi:hypothetical protein